jgi:hypothetical protein
VLRVGQGCVYEIRFVPRPGLGLKTIVFGSGEGARAVDERMLAAVEKVLGKYSGLRIKEAVQAGRS